MIRVLWLAGNPALYAHAQDQHGGWIGALQRELLKESNLSLSVAFPWKENLKIERDTCTYYGVEDIKHSIVGYKPKLQKLLCRLRDVVDDCQPDIIHVFGSEIAFGLVNKCTDVPVVIHIQGILSAIYEAWLPQNLSWCDYVLRSPRMYLGYNALQKSIPREKDILRHCKYLMGRTDWDQNIAKLLAPDAKYFHCDEVLRPEIYAASPWQYHQASKLTIVSIIGNSVYKGADVILRTAKILKEWVELDFEWQIVGVENISWAEKHVGIKAQEVGVMPIGRAETSKLIDILHSADVFVHPSYIENSSNAICEAQCVGLPVIATHVGGTTSLVEHEKTGIIVPANDVYMLAAQIYRLANNPEICIALGQNARVEALKRHKPATIISSLLKIYQYILYA